MQQHAGRPIAQTLVRDAIMVLWMPVMLGVMLLPKLFLPTAAVVMGVEALAGAKTVAAAKKRKNKMAKKPTILNNIGANSGKNATAARKSNKKLRGKRTCLSFSPVIRNEMDETDREELRRVSVQAADDQWSACWNKTTLSGSSAVGDARPYAYLGRAKLKAVKLARILYFLELSALSPALKKECKRIWKSKNAKQRTNTLKMFADEALQVCK